MNDLSEPLMPRTQRSVLGTEAEIKAFSYSEGPFKASYTSEGEGER